MIDSGFKGKERGLPSHDNGEGAESPEEMRRELAGLNREIIDASQLLLELESPKLKQSQNRIH